MTIPLPSFDTLSAALYTRYNAAATTPPEVERILTTVAAYENARRLLAVRSLAELVGSAAPPPPEKDLATLAQEVYEAVRRLPHLAAPVAVTVDQDALAAPKEPVYDLPYLRASEVDTRPVLVVGGTLDRVLRDRLKTTVPGVLFESTDALSGTMRARLTGALAKNRVRGVLVVTGELKGDMYAVIDMECRFWQVVSADVTSLSYDKLRAALVTLNRLVMEGSTAPASALR